MVRNDDGAWATRHMLTRELAAGRDRLAGKRVVVWQFAVRELAMGDWRIIPLDLGTPTASDVLDLKPGHPVSVSATVQSVSAVPVPGSVPYRNHLLTAHVVDIEGLPEGSAHTREAIVLLFSMKDNQLQPAAFLRNGQSVRLRLAALGDAAEDLDAINRSELDDDQWLWHPLLWGVLEDTAE